MFYGRSEKELVMNIVVTKAVIVQEFLCVFVYTTLAPALILSVDLSNRARQWLALIRKVHLEVMVWRGNEPSCSF